MITLSGIYTDTTNFTFVDALIVSLVAILIVFAVLVVIILVSSILNTGIEKATEPFEIRPRNENKLLLEDEDAVVACLVASIEFQKEFKKDSRLVSIKKVK